MQNKRQAAAIISTRQIWCRLVHSYNVTVFISLLFRRPRGYNIVMFSKDSSLGAFSDLKFVVCVHVGVFIRIRVNGRSIRKYIFVFSNLSGFAWRWPQSRWRLRLFGSILEKEFVDFYGRVFVWDLFWFRITLKNLPLILLLNSCNNPAVFYQFVNTEHN